MTLDEKSNSLMSDRWTRDTKWRQGSVVPEGAIPIEAAGSSSAAANVLVVISHDCDLAEDDLEAEPFVELMRAEPVTAAEPHNTHAKSPNTLDLEIVFEGETQALRLRAYHKLSVLKKDLACVRPDSRYSMDEKARSILQRWLAARYRRAALPDALHGHLSAIRRTLQEIGKKSPHAILGFYIGHEPDEELTNPEEPYEVWITVVFDHTVVGAEHVAVEAAQRIAARLERKFKTEIGWRSIELRSCEGCSDLLFSLYDAQTLKLYRLEHISLKHAAKAPD